jgi:hypothetical protein
VPNNPSLTVDLQEAVRLAKPATVHGLEVLETSGHWNALEELGQRILQKVFAVLKPLTSGTFSADWIDKSTCRP